MSAFCSWLQPRTFQKTCRNLSVSGILSSDSLWISWKEFCPSPLSPYESPKPRSLLTHSSALKKLCKRHFAFVYHYLYQDHFRSLKVNRERHSKHFVLDSYSGLRHILHLKYLTFYMSLTFKFIFKTLIKFTKFLLYFVYFICMLYVNKTILN